MKSSLAAFVVIGLLGSPIAGFAKPPVQVEPSPAAATKPTSTWSDEAVTTTAPERGAIKFHGPFVSQPVTLTVKGLPDHAWVRIRFDLLMLGSWDGSDADWGPDMWTLQVRGGPRLFFTTLSAFRAPQSFPDNFPWGECPDRTGASARNTLLPLPNLPAAQRDSTFPVEAIFPHKDGTLTLDFNGLYADDPSENQTWGVANFQLEVLDQPPKIDDAALPKLWQLLGDADPVKANAALWMLVGAGDHALAMIAEQVGKIVPDANGKPLAAAELLRLHRAERICQLIGGDQSIQTQSLIWPNYPGFTEKMRSVDNGNDQ